MFKRFTSELYMRNMIFDFATEYYWSHPQPASLDSLKITGTDLEQFAGFLRKRNFSYKTGSEILLGELADAAREEDLYDANSKEIEMLKKGLSHSLERDLEAQKDDITELIESELAGRYFYDAGVVEYSLAGDTQVQEALRIAGDKERLYAVLHDTKP